MDAKKNDVQTIIFYVTDKEDGLKAVKYLTDDIKANEEANHKLYFRFLMNDMYQVTMGCTDDDGQKHLIGNHEVLFIPSSKLGKWDVSFSENKKIIFQKNCMIMAGEGEKTKAMRALLIDWLLEKKKEIKL